MNTKWSLLLANTQRYRRWLVTVGVALLAGLGNASLVQAAPSCASEGTLFQVQYVGACGYEQQDKFTLSTSSTVTWVRIWYNTSKAPNGLNATMTGPNGQSLSQATTKGGCYSTWCEGKFIINNTLAAGTYNISVDSNAVCANPSGDSTLIVYGCAAASAPQITSASSATATVGQSFSYQIQGSGTPSSYNASGLPAGLSVNTSSGAISGTPSVAGTYTVQLAASNSSGTGTATLTLTVAASGTTTTTSTVVRIAGGGDHTVAIKADGGLWLWGDNQMGEIGDGTTTSALLPKQIGSAFRTITAGEYRTLAIKTDGTLWAWGENQQGWLGDGYQGNGSINNVLSPKQIGSGYSLVATGGGTTGAHTVALKSDGSLWTWGDNFYGQLGHGSINLKIASSVPIQISTGYTAIAAGNTNGYALKADGSLWAWGDNSAGQLGDGTTTASYTPKQVGTGYTAIAAGTLHVLALKSDGSLWAWGYNDSGQIGDGTTTNSLVPKQIGSGYAAMAAGAVHSVALKTDGSVWTWGDNYWGQLGNGDWSDSAAKSLVPKQIGSGFSAVAAGAFHSIALKPDGTLWTWGKNQRGQIGNGKTAYSSPSPQQVGSGYPVSASSNGNQLADCLFNWLEARYAVLFAPSGTQSQTYASYYLRYYSQTNAYLGIAANRLVYLGPATANALTDLGAATSWYSTAACQ